MALWPAFLLINNIMWSSLCVTFNWLLSLSIAGSCNEESFHMLPPNCTDFHMQWDNSGWSMLITIYSFSLTHSFLHIQQVPIFSMSCLTPLCRVWGNQLAETDYAEIQKAWPVYLHLPENKEVRGLLLLNIIIFIAPESWAATLDNLFPEFRYIGINRLVIVIRKQATNG